MAHEAELDHEEARRQMAERAAEEAPDRESPDVEMVDPAPLPDPGPSHGDATVDGSETAETRAAAAAMDARTDAARTDAARTDADRADAARTDAARTDADRAEDEPVEAVPTEDAGMVDDRPMTVEPDTTATEAAPGDVDVAPVADLWPGEKIEALRERWREVQLHFVDDPRSAAAEADSLVVEAIQTLTAALDEQRTDLAGWRRESGDEDTEHLRVAVRRYRTFLDKVLAL